MLIGRTLVSFSNYATGTWRATLLARRITNLPHAYSTATRSPLSDIILSGAPLTPRSKRCFRDYWKAIATCRPQEVQNSLMDDIPLPDLIHFLKKNRDTSSTVRGIYRRECLLNCKKSPKQVEQLLTSLGFAFDGDLTPARVLSISINDSLKTRDVTIAADLYFFYYKLFPHDILDTQAFSTIISALAFENPKYDHVHLIKYLELHQLFKDRNQKPVLSQIQIVTLCNKALSLENSPLLTKEALTKLMNIEIMPCDNYRDDKMTAAYNLIIADYKINNVAGILLTWASICNEYASITKHDPRILHKILKIFTHHKAYRKHFKHVFQQIPPDYYCNNPLLLPSIIDYATKTGDLSMAQTVMDKVNTHISPQNTQIVLFSKRCLSSLLRMHLKFKDSTGVDRVLKQILEIFGKHSEENLFAVISHLVNVKTLENLSRAILLANSIPQNRALLAYGAILNKIVEWQIASDGRFDIRSLPLMEEMLIKAHRHDPHHKSSLWTIIASLFIKKIVHYRRFQRKANRLQTSSRLFDTTNLDLAKLIYTRSASNGTQSSMTDYNPFTSPCPQKVLLKITNNNRLIILKNIALSAIKGKRKDIFLWCCSELYDKGMPVQELLIDWNMMLKHELRSTQFSDKKQLQEELSLKGLPFIENALR